MSQKVAILSDEIVELAYHMITAKGGGDYRKERCQIAERHNLPVAEVNDLLKDVLYNSTTEDEYTQLRATTGSLLD